MKLTGLHLLLTYQCNLECDHCFVWGSPWQSGTMTLQNVRKILQQAKDLRTVEWIYFEGGEPFLYYAMLVLRSRFPEILGPDQMYGVLEKRGITYNARQRGKHEEREPLLY